jgi:hypothetical protein
MYHARVQSRFDQVSATLRGYLDDAVAANASLAADASQQARQRVACLAGVFHATCHVDSCLAHVLFSRLLDYAWNVTQRWLLPRLDDGVHQNSGPSFVRYRKPEPQLQSLRTAALQLRLHRVRGSWKMRGDSAQSWQQRFTAP